MPVVPGPPSVPADAGSAMTTPAPTPGIEDVQARADTRRIAINRVGIKDIAHPVTVTDRSGTQATVARFNMYVNLHHDLKGTNMSRFVAILNEHHDSLSVATFPALLAQMVQRLGAEEGRLEASFPFFVAKKAPVSGIESRIDYTVSLIAERTSGGDALWLRVVVPVTSLCPCSRDISRYGAHNQRSHVTIRARPRSQVWLQDLIDVAESEGSCELFGLLKRADEKFVTEKAYENPKFVEDIVRDVAARLNSDERIGTYVVECENFESIHNHSAYALIEGDKDSQ